MTMRFVLLYAIFGTIALLALGGVQGEREGKAATDPSLQNFVRQQQSIGAVKTSEMVYQQEHGTTLQRARWAAIEPGQESLTGICSVADVQTVPTEPGVGVIQVECNRSNGSPNFVERLHLPASAESFVQHVNPGAPLAYRGDLVAVGASRTPGVNREVSIQPDALMVCPRDQGCRTYRAPGSPPPEDARTQDD